MGEDWNCFLCDDVHGEQHYRTGSYNGVGIITVNGNTICSKCRRDKKFCRKCGEVGINMDDSDYESHKDKCEGRQLENSRRDYEEKATYAMQNNVDPVYQWYHTQNNDGYRYVVEMPLFRTRFECLDHIREFRASRVDGEEKRLNLTYVIQHFVMCKFTASGKFDSGIKMPDEELLPEHFVN